MKVILLENVSNLGEAGDVVDVKSGYCRNYLVPRGMAEVLSTKALAEVEELKKVAIRRAERELAKAREIAGKLEGHTVKIAGKTGARGARLYGSVTTQAIATAIASFTGSETDKRKISLPEPVKMLGLHKYVYKIHPEVTIEGQLEVVKQENQ